MWIHKQRNEATCCNTEVWNRRRSRRVRMIFFFLTQIIKSFFFLFSFLHLTAVIIMWLCYVHNNSITPPRLFYMMEKIKIVWQELRFIGHWKTMRSGRKKNPEPFLLVQFPCNNRSETTFKNWTVIFFQCKTRNALLGQEPTWWCVDLLQKVDFSPRSHRRRTVSQQFYSSLLWVFWLHFQSYNLPSCFSHEQAQH